MEGGITELSAYRFLKSQEDLRASEIMLKEGIYKASINRSYYAVFHAMRSVTALESFDSSKHSGVIAFFNRNFVKTGIFDKAASRIVKRAALVREKSDYQDFYIASKQEAEEQLENAKMFAAMIRQYLQKRNVIA